MAKMTLALQMEQVVDHIEAAVLADKASGQPTDHHELCTTTAEHFHLWIDDRFPIWLSRIVEGAIQDHNPEAQP